jgi:MerR family copper efflux transcriptional regulator
MEMSGNTEKTMGNDDVGGQDWRIGELGRRTGVNPKTIRYYEEAGLLPPPSRTESGYRIYSEADVAQVEFIRAAKDFGFTLGEIREILAVRERNETPCPYVLGLVREKLADLHARIQRLQLLSEDLEEILQEAATIPPEIRARKGQYCHVIENRHMPEQEDKSTTPLDLPL